MGAGMIYIPAEAKALPHEGSISSCNQVNMCMSPTEGASCRFTQEQSSQAETGPDFDACQFCNKATLWSELTLTANQLAYCSC